MSLRTLVFDTGDEIYGHGRLVSTPDGDWFDPPLPVESKGYGSSGPPAPSPSSHGIPVDGADFDAVRDRYERDGSIEGMATIYGVWLGDRVRIERQTDDYPQPTRPRWTEPPCPPPLTGWPHSMPGREGTSLKFDLGDLRSSGAAVTAVIFRPSPDQPVLVVAATDVPTVEAHLRPQLGARLCVVQSRWTEEQIDSARQHLRQNWDRWTIFGSGRGVDEQGQAIVTASLVRVTAESADWTATYSRGLVILEPFLAPVGGMP